MAIILNLETATKNCSVSLSEKGKLLSLVELNEINFSHAEKLHSFILKALKESGLKMKDLDAVAVSKGPGSYTGLRIGVSAAKGICFALDIPLISISTLNSLANAISVKKDEVIIPLLDAKRMEVYSAVFNSSYKQIRKTEAEIIDSNSFKTYFQSKKVYLLGDGAFKCKEVIKSENVVFVDNIFPSAKEMIKLSFEKFSNNDFEDLAYFEPYYLKDFIAGKPKRILN